MRAIKKEICFLSSVRVQKVFLQIQEDHFVFRIMIAGTDPVCFPALGPLGLVLYWKDSQNDYTSAR